MTAQHPSRRRLQRWLDTGESRRVSKHIDNCEDCQEVLEALSALDVELVADLQAATTPPEDLRERTHGGVDSRLRNEAAIVAFADLFAIGWDVARHVVDPTPDSDMGTDSDAPHDDSLDADKATGGPR